MLIYHQIHKCKNDHTMMNICVAKMDLIPNEICTKCIIDFCEKYNDVIHKEINNKNSNTMIFFAHHCYIKKCYDEMKKYCHDAIEHGNNIAFYYLANYYETIEKNYDLTKQYYLCGIQKNDHNSMLGLGYYYDEIENDYDQAKKYYLMAVNYGNFFAMNNLGYYYANIQKNLVLAKKYYLMAIELEYDDSLFLLSKIMNTINIYFSVNNKKFVMDNIDSNKQKIIKKFINNSTKQMCRSCYLENDCCLKNDVYLCGLCY